MRRGLGILGCGLSLGCSPGSVPVLPDPDADLGLGDVVFMTWTTRSPEGLLGHTMIPQRIGVDPLRKVLEGTPVFTETSQHLKVMLTKQAEGGVKATPPGPVGAQAGVSGVTHIAYDVHVTRYLGYSVANSHYAADSGCCLAGEPSPACGEWYVASMMWGSGHSSYLQRVDADASVSAGELFRAHGGTSYRLLNQMEFENTFFAYEAAPLADLCARVAPEDEVPALSVTAPHNCRAQVVQTAGEHQGKSWYAADQALCQTMVDQFCTGLVDVQSCRATFSADGTSNTLELRQQIPVPAATPVVPPPATNPPGKKPQ